MTPHTVAGLTIHEHDDVDSPLGMRPALATGGSVISLPRDRFAREGGGQRRRLIPHRDSFHRRLLSAADALAASAALLLVLGTVQGTQLGLLVAGVPLVVVLFKVAG